MGRSRTTISKTGPFFRHDPVKTFRENVQVMMKTISEEGERDVIHQLEAGASRRAPIKVGAGRVSDQVEGYVRGIRSGRHWQATARVHIRNVGLTKARAISLHAAAAVLESRTHAFRRTTGRIARRRAANMDELLKGIQ